jgi:hypothetical protein
MGRKKERRRSNINEIVGVQREEKNEKIDLSGLFVLCPWFPKLSKS